MSPSARTVCSGDVELHVREWGDPEAPTVLLVHGYPDTSTVWNLVAERLAGRFHVVAHDNRGSGASTAPRGIGFGGYRMERLVDDIAAVIDATSPDRPVHVVGHDWGSIQSWEAVASQRLAGRVASYTSTSGPCLDHVGYWFRDRLRRPTPRNLVAVAGQLAKSWYVVAFQLPLAPLAWRLGAGRGFRRFLERVEGVDAAGDHPAPTLAADGRRGVALYRANMLPRLLRPRPRRVEIPVQVVHPVGDRFVSPKLVDGLDRWVPHLYVRTIDGSHWVLRTEPDSVARAVTELVDHVEGGPEPRGLKKARRGADRFAGSLVVVTGAGSGIGRETTLAFAERGAEVVAVDIDEGAAARTAELARLLGVEAHHDVVDVGDAGAMELFAEQLHKEHGAPDVVVNNAGIGMAGAFLATGVDDWERILNVNLWGVIHGCRLFAAQMVERGEGGHIVNIASAAAFAPNRTIGAYATTKAAVLTLSDSLRGELVGHGIGVSTVCPGFADTPITTSTRYVGTDDVEQDRRRRAAARLYRRRGLQPSTVAAAVVGAVEHGRDLVPVGTEAQLLQRLQRFAPGLSRWFARLDISPA